MASGAVVPRGINVAAIARAMVGTDLPPPPRVAAPDAGARAVLELAHVDVGDELRAIDLTVRAGEIVGVAGVDGNGQRELALAIAGLVRLRRGEIRIAGRDVSHAAPAERLALGLAHIAEDRQHGGLWLDATIADNLALGRGDISGRFRIDRARVVSHAATQIAELDIRPSDPGAVVRALSGGNQQKVVVGRELSRPQLSCVLASQPTRGVDLGAIVRIHDRLRGAATAGAGVLVISADLDELLTLCHRIVVVLRGRIVGERGGAALREAGARAALGALMTGVEAA
jgi:simple sugar transport system ATP-binding protein